MMKKEKVCKNCGNKYLGYFNSDHCDPCKPIVEARNRRLRVARNKAYKGELSVQEIADKISVYLKEFEKNQTVIKKEDGGNEHTKYYCARAFKSGAYVSICYKSYQGFSNYKKEKALQYLRWLEAGNVGTIYEMKEG
jgi:hypothetical protein